MTPRRQAKKVMARVRCEERKHATYFAGKHDRCIRYVQGEATRAVHAAMFAAAGEGVVMLRESLPPCRLSTDPDVQCPNQSDQRYSMDFTDVEAGQVLHFCATCGPVETAMVEAIEARFDEPGFADKFMQAIADATRGDA